MRAFLIGWCLGLLLLGVPPRVPSADIDCDGIDDLLSTGLATSTFLSAGAFTVTAYLKSSGSVFASASCYNEGPFLMDTNEFVAVGRTGDTGTGSACGYLADDTLERHVLAATAAGWQHITVRLQGGTLELFVNGSSVQTSAAGDVADLTSELRLCGGIDGASPDRITEVQTYTVGVPTAEIETLALSRLRGVGRTPSTATWPLTDCADGTSAHGVLLPDRSGFGRSLTGTHGGNAAGLTCRASEFVSFLWGAH